jgi:hypothetical protein
MRGTPWPAPRPTPRGWPTGSKQAPRLVELESASIDIADEACVTRDGQRAGTDTTGYANKPGKPGKSATLAEAGATVFVNGLADLLLPPRAKHSDPP